MDYILSDVFIRRQFFIITVLLYVSINMSGWYLQNDYFDDFQEIN